jgi:hypothetical protein
MILGFPLLAPRFERMVAEVCLGKVGPVAAREVLRFARNSNDWQQPISHVGGLLSIINSSLAVERGIMRVQCCDEARDFGPAAGGSGK